MSRPTHHQIETLVRELVLPAHHVLRDIRLPTGRPERENDAEHSWSLALVAGCLGPVIDPSLNIGRVTEIAVAHDLIEVAAGDTSVFAGEEHLATKDEREHAALEDIEHRYAHFPWLAATINEYKDRSTNEAKFVYALDKYIPLLYDYIDQGAYLREHGISHADYDLMRTKHRQKAQTHPAVGEYYDQVLALIDAHPEYFHQLA
jgi:5'-deoxynucleotidase YfbR-like HD superfamily hydrolase